MALVLHLNLELHQMEVKISFMDDEPLWKVTCLNLRVL